MNRLKTTMSDKILIVCTLLLIGGTYFWLATRPINILSNLFFDEVGMQTIEAEEYGQYAGLPAGADIPVLADKDEYEKYYETEEYFTFKTDYIVPLDIYRLKDIADTSERFSFSSRSGSRRVGGPTHTIYNELYSTAPSWLKRKLYNRYYLVQLPDENYAFAYLDDYYYYKYKRKGSVNLPIGRVWHTKPEERELLSDAGDKYNADETKILQMFSESRYIKYKECYEGILVISILITTALWLIIAGVIGRWIGRRSKGH